MSSKSTPPGRIDELDIARALTAIAVVAIHAVGYSLTREAAGSANQMIDQLLTLALRFSRLVFMLISGFTLAYVYRTRTVNYGSFLARRGWRTALPYLTWSALYFAVSMHYRMLTPNGPVALAFFKALLLGTAFYHLYFMTVSLQWYAFFPPVLAAARRLKRWGLWAAAAVILSGYLAFMAWFAHGAPLPSRVRFISFLVANRDHTLITYLGYYLLGTLAGLHGEAVLAAIRRYWAVAAAAVVTTFRYMIHGLLIGGSAQFARSVDVFQPVLCLYGIAVTALLLAVAAPIAAAGGPLKRHLMATAKDSYTVYLAHPLFLFLVEFYGLGHLPWIHALVLPLTASGVALPLWLAGRAERIPVVAPVLLGRPAVVSRPVPSPAEGSMLAPASTPAA